MSPAVPPTHQRKAEIVRHIIRYVDEVPPDGGDQDEAMQGLKKDLVWEGGVRLSTSHESLDRKG